MKVVMLDLTCQVPFYDRYLAGALKERVAFFNLYAQNFRFEPDYLRPFTTHSAIELVDISNHLPLPGTRARQIARGIEYVINWMRLLALFRRDRPDIVHVQTLPFFPKYSWETGLLRIMRRMGIQVVYTMHNYMPHDQFSLRSGRVHTAVLESVDALVVHTETDREMLLAESGSVGCEIALIPHGPLFHDQYDNPVKQIDRAEFGLDDDDVVFMSFGLVRPYKGLKEFLRSFARVARTASNARLMIVGRPLDLSYYHELQSIAVAEGISKQVRWVNRYVPSDQVGAFHELADILVFPYRRISQSGAFLTAAGLGKFTLWSGTGGIGEIARESSTGVQVDILDHDSVIQGIQICLGTSKEERRKQGIALRDYVMTNLTWDVIADSTVSLYGCSR